MGSPIQALEAHPEYRWNGVKGGNEARVGELKSLLMGSARKAAAQDLPHDAFYGYGGIDAVKLESMM